MPMPDEILAAFKQASTAVEFAFLDKDIQAGDTPTPKQLIEAINKFFVIYEKLGSNPEQNHSFSKESISEIGEQTISCLVELSAWAEKLHLSREKAILNELALAVAHWVIRHRGEIRNLEVIVNMLAAKANQTSDQTVLTALFHVMNDVIENTAPELKNGPDKSEPDSPWRMLNFNFAIVATRTMNKDLMTSAFDTLGRNLPEDCPQFFEEGLRQSEKAVYGPEIKAMMAEYFKKWATLH
jgi:hypothetical protein